MIEGKAELSPDESLEKLVYFDSRNNEGYGNDDSEESVREKRKCQEIEEMEEYLNKKRLLWNKIGKLKFIRLYMDKPEVKKRRRREGKKKQKDNKEVKEDCEKKSKNIILLNTSELIPSITPPQNQIPEIIQELVKSPFVPLINPFDKNPELKLINPPVLTHNQSDQVALSVCNLPSTIENPFVPSIWKIPRKSSDPVSLPMSSPQVISTPNFQMSSTPFFSFNHQFGNYNEIRNISNPKGNMTTNFFSENP